MGARTGPLRLTLPGSVVDPDPSIASIHFIGTATVILRYCGLTILTDPNFLHAGDHAHLGYGLRSERLTNPALEIEQLPPVDFCLLSHFHGDHFDPVAERKLRKNLPIVTTAHAARELEERGFGTTIPLQTWQTLLVNKGPTEVGVTAMPARHGPGFFNALLPDVMGSMLEFRPGGGRTALRLYITGDTLVHDELRQIPRRYPDIDLALFHLGGTRVMGVLVSMDAAQGVECMRIVNPQKVLPIHYNDYKVFKSPLEDFVAAVQKAGFADRVICLNHGETYEFTVPGMRRQGSAARVLETGDDAGGAHASFSSRSGR